MLALAVNVRKSQAITHASVTRKIIAQHPIRGGKQQPRLGNVAISVTSIGQSALVLASCFARLVIWRHTSEGELLLCSGHKGAVLQIRQLRMPGIEAAGLAVQTELRACGDICELVHSNK